MSDLPTIEQCREFLRTINRGRVAIGLDPLVVLDFDGAVPDSDRNCLSARNLFALSPKHDTWVMPVYVKRPDPRLLCVLDDGSDLPESITAVTRHFDACAGEFGPGVRTDAQALAALRSRMVEAGVVAP